VAVASVSSGEWRRDRQTSSYCQQCCGGDDFRARRVDERPERQPRTVGGTGGVCARVHGAWRGCPCRTTLTGPGNRYTERPIDRTIMTTCPAVNRQLLTIALTRSYRRQGRRDHGLQGDRRKGIIVRVVRRRRPLPGRWYTILFSLLIDILLFPVEPTGDVFPENPRRKNNR
jgi:hypothetical protein